MRHRVPTWLLFWVSFCLAMAGFGQPSMWVVQYRTGNFLFVEEHEHVASVLETRRETSRATRRPQNADSGWEIRAPRAEWAATVQHRPSSRTWWRDWITTLPPDPLVDSPIPLRAPPARA